MPPLNFIVFPYRGRVFERRYGLTVRDLQFLNAIRNSQHTNKLLIIERPTSIYELVLGHYSKPTLPWVNKIAIDPVGPLAGRRWCANCYQVYTKFISNLTQRWRNVVLLDFTPLANVSRLNIPHDFYWYDLIDNFVKHNRFSKAEKLLVQQKYCIVNRTADLITGVTGKSLMAFDPAKTMTVSNGINQRLAALTDSQSLYKYGFIGFITNKFDVSWVEALSLADEEFSMCIYGKSLCTHTLRRLQKIPGVSYKGAFNSDKTPEIISLFDVGVIPYMPERSHDESPLKLYQYLQHGRPVMSSMKLEIESPYVICSARSCLRTAVAQINTTLLKESHAEVSNNAVKDYMYVQTKVALILEKILVQLRL